MILKGKELDALIAQHEKKRDDAYRNYQDTGNGRYYNTFNKHEDMVDTLRVVKTAAGDTICANRLRGVISNWAGIVAQMPYMTSERKEAETCKLLNDILKVASES